LAPTDFDDRMAVLSPHVFEGVPLTQAAERLVRRIMHRLDPGLVALAHHDPDVHRASSHWCCAANRLPRKKCGRPTTPSLICLCWTNTASGPGHG
jgi:hypothetical protein